MATPPTPLSTYPLDALAEASPATISHGTFGFRDPGQRHDTTPLAPHSSPEGKIAAFPDEPSRSRASVLRNRNVYVSGLPATFTNEAFASLMSQYGPVESVHLVRRRPRNSDDVGCHYGFALMQDGAHAQRAIRSLNGAVLDPSTSQRVEARLSTNDIKGSKGAKLYKRSQELRTPANPVPRPAQMNPLVSAQALEVRLDHQAQDFSTDDSVIRNARPPQTVPTLPAHDFVPVYATMPAPNQAAASAQPCLQSYVPLGQPPHPFVGHPSGAHHLFPSSLAPPAPYAAFAMPPTYSMAALPAGYGHGHPPATAAFIAVPAPTLPAFAPPAGVPAPQPPHPAVYHPQFRLYGYPPPNG
jgi:hypothetical protein